MNQLRFGIQTVLLVAVCCGGGCRPQPGPVAGRADDVRTIRVDVLTADKVMVERTTTQPATVHAYYEAEVFAKATGYLSELHVDIGASVKAGDVLAVISIPEMGKQRQAQQAGIRRLEAEERQVEFQQAVAEASVRSFAAKLDKAKAEVAKSAAALTAAQVELNRVKDLVSQRAVAERLQDEAQKRQDAAAAEKSAAEAAVAAADADLSLAKAQSEAAQADIEVAKAMTDVSRRSLEELDEMINYARLTAPFDGVVTQRNVDPGDLVRNTQSGGGQDAPPLLIVAQLDKVRVRVPVPERDASLATVGDSVQVSLQALPGVALEGQISRVSGALDEQTRTMLVEIDLPNSDGRLRPGMFGQAVIALAPPEEMVSLPAAAVRFDESGGSYVYVLNAADEVAVVAVQTGLDDGQGIEITSGLEGGERIVGPTLRRLKPGQKVAVKAAQKG